MTNTKRFLCLYHAGCLDGFGAAWVVRKCHGAENVDFVAVRYNQPPPDVKDRRVYIVDFSYKLDVMRQILNDAAHVVLIDHHVGAKEELEPLIQDPPFNLSIKYDMNFSGAVLTWKYLFRSKEMPMLLEILQDHDLYKFKFDMFTKYVIAALVSYPYDFDVWDKFFLLPDLSSLVNEGQVLLRKINQDIERIVSETKRRMIIGGYDIAVANVPRIYRTEAGNYMYQDESEPFVATYCDTARGRVFSLRSRNEGFDVNQIAKLYGGSGHAHAAGFTMPIGWEGDPELRKVENTEKCLNDTCDWPLCYCYPS